MGGPAPPAPDSRAGRLGPRVLALLALASLAIGALWWFLAERMFQGNARSILPADALAFALAAISAYFASRTWRGRGLAFLFVVGLAVVGLLVAWVVYNTLNPPME
ncbi:MAG: hypothetical protein ACYC2H_10480 [Thermoplasmatota archaeon]